MKNNRLWRGAVLVLTLLPVAELLTAIALLPDTVAVHWGLDGTPDRYSSRFELLIPVAIILLVGAVFWFKGKGEQPKGFRAGGKILKYCENVKNITFSLFFSVKIY